MKLQHGHTYRTRCGWVGKAEQNGIWFRLTGAHIVVYNYGGSPEWSYTAYGLFAGFPESDPSHPMHIVEEVFDTARASLIESLRGIAESWHEPLAKAHMIALLEIIDELRA